MEELGAGSGRSRLATPPPPSAPTLPPPPPPPPGAAPPSLSREPSFHGSGGTLLGIHVVNVLLIIVTLGVYYVWAKTRVRRYIFSQTSFEGDRFAYHGTGKELLLGFLKAFLVFLLPIIGLTIVRDQLDVDPRIKNGAAFLISVLFLVFIPVAMVGSRRYRLTRTSWRGIRFAFRGRARNFVVLFIKGYLLSLVTFGLYYPIYLTRRQAFMVSNSYFGNERFDFDGRGRDLLAGFVLAVLLTLPTVGLCWIWYLARKRRFFWDHTTFGTARFRSTVSGGALLGLYVVNLLLLVITLGIAWPWVRARNLRFTYRYLALEGVVDFEHIRQQAQFASTTGEGLAGFLDTGFDLG